MTYPQQLGYALGLAVMAPVWVPLLCAGVVIAYVAIVLALVFNIGRIKLI